MRCHGQRGRASFVYNELLRGIITGDARERDLEITCYCDLDQVLSRFGRRIRPRCLARRPIFVRSSRRAVERCCAFAAGYTYMPHVRSLVDDMSSDNGDNKASL